jgi:predicted PurR-regulated permease PerM
MPASRALDDDSVVPLVRKTAAWAWRLLVIVLAVVVLLWVVRRLQVIVVPVALATMVAALMVPAVDWLDRRGAPRGGAVALVLLGGAAIFGGILTFVVSQFVSACPAWSSRSPEASTTCGDWLIEGPRT